MKIVVIGGTGLIGSKLVAKLAAAGHNAVAAAPATGVNTITGEGLAAAQEGADVVVDVANSPSFEDQAVLEFFTKAARNIAAAEASAGVRHHVGVSIVGTDLLPDSGYLRAKLAQEHLVRASATPHTILRSTQFYEFIRGIANSAGAGESIVISTGQVQPVTADDLASVLLDLTLADPINGLTEVGGPERFALSDLVQRFLIATKDTRRVIADANATYFGTVLAQTSLVPKGQHRTTKTGFNEWIANAMH